MPDIELHKEYQSTGGSVQDFFDSPGEGFYVPPYQREYTWEQDNINQLFEDLVSGIYEFSKNQNATTFLGTTILTPLSDKGLSVMPGDKRAQPTGVLIVIDGQQRISTLALISIQIIAKLNRLLDNLPLKEPYDDLHNVSSDFIERLDTLYAFKQGKGAKPSQKPKIIRAEDDHWTHRGDDTAYTTPVTRFIARYISSDGDIDAAYTALNTQSGGVRVRRNVELIGQWLDAICDAHIPPDNETDDMTVHGQFPVGRIIAKDQIQEHVLGFTNSKIKAIVGKLETNKEKNNYYAVAIYQLLLMTYYLLRHCGINQLLPKYEEQGFDMFQALNATGTPLTVMETFLPQVMQAEKSKSEGWDDSPSKTYMNQVQQLLSATSTNQKKNKRTNELLGTFALCFKGEKLGNKFSVQRKWLTKIYEDDLDKIEEKRKFLKKLAQTADFFYFVWYMEEPVVPELDEHSDRELVLLLIQYLRNASSKLSMPILARFYSQAVEGESTIDEFVESVKACAAFFTLWRSARTNTGLDDIYRKYFRGDETLVHVKGHNWNEHSEAVTSQDLKKYFRETLVSRDIGERSKWIAESERFLLYTDLKTICRFVLFIASHDRVSDSANPGLSVKGNNGSCPMLTLERWKANDYRSIEHVAPQNPIKEHTWDPVIYTDNLIHQVGNLILLPQNLNKSASNSNWPSKYEYYRKVSRHEKIREDKTKKGAEGKKKTESLSFLCAVEPVLKVGESDSSWDANMIINRTEQIKKLAWTTLNSWLES